MCRVGARGAGLKVSMSAANKENEWPAAGATLAPKSGGLRSPAPVMDDGSLTLALSELLGRTHAEATHDPLVLAVRRDRHAPTPWRQLLQREEQLAEAAPDKLAAQRKLLVTYSHATRAMGSTDEYRKQPDFAAVWVSFARLQGCVHAPMATLCTESSAKGEQRNLTS